MSKAEDNQPDLSESVDLLGLLPQPYKSTLEAELMLRWNEIAAFSYASYVQQGRGLLLINLGETLEIEYLGWKHLRNNWTVLMQDESPGIANLIRKYVPTYIPEQEMAALISYGNQDDALFMKITSAAVSRFYQPVSEPIPVVQRAELLSPRDAYLRS